MRSPCQASFYYLFHIFILKIRFFDIRKWIFSIKICSWYEKLFLGIKNGMFDIKKSNFWYKNIEFTREYLLFYSGKFDFFILKNRVFDIKKSHFLISRIWFFATKTWIFDPKKCDWFLDIKKSMFFFISRNRFFISISWLQNHISWYQEFNFSLPKHDLWSQEMWLISWYQKSIFFFFNFKKSIFYINFFISKIICFIKNHFLIWKNRIVDIKKSNSRYQEILSLEGSIYYLIAQS